MNINDCYVIDEMIGAYNLLIDGYNANNENIRNQRLREAIGKFDVIIRLLQHSNKD